MIQNLVITRGEPFEERFFLRNSDGSSTSGKGFKFSLVIYRKDYVKEFPLRNRGNFLELKMKPSETRDLDSNTLSYKIIVEKETKEVVALGFLRVQ